MTLLPPLNFILHQKIDDWTHLRVLEAHFGVGGVGGCPIEPEMSANFGWGGVKNRGGHGTTTPTRLLSGALSGCCWHLQKRGHFFVRFVCQFVLFP